MIARGVVVSKLANKQVYNATKTFLESYLNFWIVSMIKLTNQLTKTNF